MSTVVGLVHGSVVCRCWNGPWVCRLHVLEWSVGLWSAGWIGPWDYGLQVLDWFMGLWSTGVGLVQRSVVYKCRIGPWVCGLQVLL